MSIGLIVWIYQVINKLRKGTTPGPIRPRPPGPVKPNSNNSPTPNPIDVGLDAEKNVIQHQEHSLLNIPLYMIGEFLVQVSIDFKSLTIW